MEITDNPQEYFITQEKPVSIVSNLTSSLKKLDSNTEPKKSVTFRHDLITGKITSAKCTKNMVILLYKRIKDYKHLKYNFLPTYFRHEI